MNTETVPKFSQRALSLKAGDCYRHYKDHIYVILGICRHTETLEELVVYQEVKEGAPVWARPVKIFFENVMVQGQKQSRFQLIERAQ